MKKRSKSVRDGEEGKEESIVLGGLLLLLRVKGYNLDTNA